MTDPHVADEAMTWLGLFLEASRGMLRHLDAAHTAHGIQGREFDVLMRLASSGGLRMSSLAAQTGTSTSGITSVVDRLTERGWAERCANPDDRRSWRIVLTERGHDVLQADLDGLKPLVQELFVAPLGPDVEVVVAALRRLRDHVEPAATDS